MAKLTLTDVSNITGAESAAIAAINNNWDAIIAAVENTLSRDGTTPNSMSADLDLNGYDLLNINEITFIPGGDLDTAIAAAIQAAVASELASKQDQSANLDTLSAITPGAAGQAILADATQQDVLDYLNATSADVSFLQSGTGASATRTIRDKIRELSTTPQDFGAAADGVTDDSTAVQAWLDDLVANNRSGLVPNGTYLLNTAVSTSASNNDFAIIGQSTGGAVFKTPSSNTTGAILIEDAGRSGQAVFHNFSIVTEASGGGTGLKFTQPEGGTQHQRAVICTGVQVRGSDGTNDYFNIFFDFTGSWRPFIQYCTADGPWIGVDQSNGSNSYAATASLKVEGCYDPTIDNCYFWGAYTNIDAGVFEGTITGVTDQGGGTVRITTSEDTPFSNGASVTITGTTSYNGTFTITRIDANNFDITDTYVASETGTCYASSGPEAFRLTNTVLSHSRIALDYYRPAGREPIVWLLGNHVNYRDNGFKINGAKLVMGSFNVPYNEDSAEEYTGTPVDFDLENCSEYIFTNNVCHFDGNPDRIAFFVESDTTGEGDNGIIAHNVFSGTFNYVIWLSANVTGVKVGPNIYSGTISNEVNDVSTNNAIRDGLTETSGSWTPALTFGGGSTGLTTSQATGVYRISGGLMTFRIDITLTAKGTSTGNADISLPTGLPGNLNITVDCGGVEWPYYAAMSGVTSPTARPTSASNLRLLEQASGVVLNMDDTNFTDTTDFTLVGHLYLT